MLKKLGVAVIVFIFIAAFTISCKKDVIQKSGDVVAIVNGHKVTTEDIKMMLGQAASKMNEVLADEQTRKDIIDDVVATELILEDARKKGLDKDHAFIQKVEDFKNKELRNIYLNKEIVEKATVSEAELTEYIKNNEDAIRTEIKAGHILVKTEAEADDVLAKLAKGEDFAKLAAAVSLDKRNSEKGGDLGPINIRDIPAMPAEYTEFEKLILSLKPGESGKLKVRAGFSVIKVTTKTVNKKLAIDNELQFKIHEKLVIKKRQSALDNLVEELRSKAKVEIKEDILKKLAATPKETEEKK